MTTTIEAEVAELAPAEELPPPPPPPPEPLAPVAPSERVETIDVLRGLALFGILAANIRGFAGPAVIYFDPARYWGAFHDRLAQAFIDTFIQGKFITLFAFLFGVGFAVQLERSETRAGKFGWTYARRLFILLVFGLIHGLLIWWGDILLHYALTGFLLLFFRKRQSKTIVIWAAIAFALPMLLMFLMLVASLAGATPPMPPPTTAKDLRELTAMFADGSWGQIQLQRMKDAVGLNWGFFLVLFAHILSLFLIGLLAWRKRIFQPGPESLPKYRRAMWIGFAIGIPGNVAVNAMRWTFDVSQMSFSALSAALSLLGEVVTPFLSLGYLCLVILLCADEAWRARLRSFGAMGRMALTNYLMQAVIGTLIFYSYGLGLFGRMGPAVLLPLTFAIYAFQVVVSVWWLRAFRYGPVEWLWRSLTYGKLFPMRRESSAPGTPLPQSHL